MSTRWIPAASFVATLLAFLPWWLDYFDVWGAQPYTHGYLIAAATIWLIWREKHAFQHPVASKPALAIAAMFSLAWLLGTVADVRSLLLATMPLVLLGWTGSVFGRNAALQFSPIAALFYLAVPVWEVLTPPLQALTIAVSGAGASLLGVPAQIDGNAIHTTYGSFLIVGGCAGLNYLLSGLTVGSIYALAFVPRWPTRLLVVSLSALLAILGNWIRVTTLILLGHWTEMESPFLAQPVPHFFHGWAIFAVGLLFFFPLARAIERRTARRWPRLESRPKAVDHPLAEFAAPLRGNPVTHAMVSSCFACIGPILYALLSAVPTRQVTPFEMDAVASGWRAEGTQLERPYDWQPSFQGPQEIAVASWTNGTDRVLLDHLVYHEQTQGAELVGYESRIAPDSSLVVERLAGPVGPRRRLVNEAVVRGSEGPLLVWYWYRVGGIETAQPLRAKMLEVLAFFRRRPTSELIAASTRCEPESCEGASQVLSGFFGST